MTHQYTKLADELDAVNDVCGSRSIREAARILRAAAGADVAGLIELAAKAIYDQWADQHGWVEWVLGGNSMNQDEARRIARAALESALRLALAAREREQPKENDAPKLWLWQNFVNGRPEYWAFDNPYPINLTDGDPQTLGEPCGYAIFKPSRQGRFDVSEERVLAAIARAAAAPKGTP